MSEQEHQPPLFLTHLLGWYALTLLGLGTRTGLLAALSEGPGSVAEIAARAGVDERNALEWLRAMTSAGHATFASDRFSLSPETAMVFGPGFPVDAWALCEFVDRTGQVLDAVAAAIRTGKGVEPQLYRRAYGAAVSRVNSPTYKGALVSDWIAGTLGLTERLTSGGRIADVAGGNGEAAGIMARAFPACSVVVIDADPGLPTAPDLPGNVELRHGDARTYVDDDGFDLVTCLDSFHHFGPPLEAARQIHGMVRPGGTLLIAESGLTGDLAVDIGSRVSQIVYSAGLLYCLQESLAAGGPGHSNGDGPGWLTEALAEAGFNDVQDRLSATGYRIFTATA